MRFAVTGGRTFNDVNLVAQALLEMPDTATLVHGGARGADRLAGRLWRGRPTEPHPAHWSGPCRATCQPGHRIPSSNGDYCPAAGAYRNQEMVDSGLDLLLVFPGGRGTADMRERAEAAGVDIVDVAAKVRVP